MRWQLSFPATHFASTRAHNSDWDQWRLGRTVNSATGLPPYDDGVILSSREQARKDPQLCGRDECLRCSSKPRAVGHSPTSGLF